LPSFTSRRRCSSSTVELELSFGVDIEGACILEGACLELRKDLGPLAFL